MATVFEMLEKEWDALSRDRAAAAQLREACHQAGEAESLGDLERFVRGAGPADADRVLLALVTRAVDGDAFAARVLLHLLLPGARRLARRWWALGDQEERAAATVAAVYHRISSYPLARRPGRVAANVLMDAARDLRRAVPSIALVPSDTVTGQLAALPSEDRVDPATELAELLRDAVRDGVVRTDDAGLIARSRITDDRVADIAARRGLHPRTLWDRRYRAERALVAAYGRAPGPSDRELASRGRHDA
jgi:hypothetical protein